MKVSASIRQPAEACPAAGWSASTRAPGGVSGWLIAMLDDVIPEPCMDAQQL